MGRAPVRLLAASLFAVVVAVTGVACGPIGSSQAPELPVSGTLPPLLQPPTSSALPKGHIPNTADVQGCFPQTIIGTASVPKVVAYGAPSTKAPRVASFRQTNPQAPFSLDVDTHTFTLTVFRSCQPAAQFPVGIGTGDTPTPIGRFYLGSLMKPLDSTGPYGDFAYGLSAYSDVITDWRWGGLVGLHGTDDPSSIGHDVSHGCIRMRNEDISLLARVLPLGTPIIIH